MNGDELMHGLEQTIDLWTGELIDGSNRPIGLLSRWQPRHAAIATELFLSNVASEVGLHLLEIALIWPDWLNRAIRLQDLCQYWQPLRWSLNEALNPVGWNVPKGKERGYRWAIEPLRTGDASYGMRAAIAVKALNEVRASLLQKDHVAAFNHATAALEYCHESLAARMTIGACVFRHGLKAHDDLVASTAEYLTRHERNLHLNIDTLPKLWGNTGCGRQRWLTTVRAFVDRYTAILEDNSDVFEAARNHIQRQAF